MILKTRQDFIAIDLQFKVFKRFSGLVGRKEMILNNI